MAEKISGAFAPFHVIYRTIIDWWDGWLDLVLVTIVWLLAQFTIVLGPPATFGLYYVVNRMTNGEALGVRGFIYGARRYFWKAWLWGLLNIAAVVVVYVNWNFYRSFQAGWVVYILALIVLMTYLFICTQFYALPYFFEQSEQKLRIALRNGIMTAMASPLFTFVLILFCMLVAAVSIVTVLPLFLGLPGWIPLSGNRGLQNRLVAYGLRAREKTPKELELEESSKIRSQNLTLGDEQSQGSATSKK